jgi:hypothetical protein
MSELGDRTDVQQIRVIAVVMITVLLGSANYCPSWMTSKRQAHAVFRILDPLRTIVERQHLPKIQVSVMRLLFFYVFGGGDLCLPVI